MAINISTAYITSHIRGGALYSTVGLSTVGHSGYAID